MVGTNAVVNVAVQNTIFNKVGFLRFNTFVININRSTIRWQCSVVNNIDKIFSYFFAHLISKN